MSRRTVRVVATIVTLISASTTSASPPSPWNSTAPPFVALVGISNGVVDPLGEFVVVVRGLSNNPLPGRIVEIDFSGCAGVTLGGPASQTFPGVTTDCTGHIISALSDANGIARFRIAGGGGAGGSSDGPAPDCVHVRAARVLLLTTPSVQIFDLDGFNGVKANDLSLWLADFARGAPYLSRSDYDGNGRVGINDLSVWLNVFGAGGSVTSAITCVP
jgi:hypothetical protein